MNILFSKSACHLFSITLLLLAPALRAQVTTNIPAVVPDAKPVTVEHIKVHGAALEGNLEGDDVDREVIVFLPPSYSTAKTGAIRWSMLYTVIS